MSEAEATVESHETEPSREALIEEARSTLALLKQASASVAKLHGSLELFSDFNTSLDLRGELDELSSNGDALTQAVFSVAELTGLLEYAIVWAAASLKE